MSGPTLELGVSATGAGAVKELADQVERLVGGLSTLKSTQGGSSADLSGLGGLAAEMRKVSQGLGEGLAGLRTQIAELQQGITKSMSDAFTTLAKGTKKGAKEVVDEMDQAGKDATAKAAQLAAIYKNAADQVAQASNRAAGEYTKFNPGTGLRGNVVMPSAVMVEKAAAEYGAAIDKRTASLMVNSAKLAEAQAQSDAKIVESQMLSSIKLGMSTMKWTQKQDADAEAAYQAAQVRSEKNFQNALKIAQRENDAVKAQEDAKLLGSVRMGVSTMKWTQKQDELSAAEEAAQTAAMYRANKSLAKFLDAKDQAADKEDSKRLGWMARMQVGSLKITEQRAAAAAAEEASTGAFIFRAQRSLTNFLAQREDEAMKVEMAAKKVEAAYQAMSTRSQLGTQYKAASQLAQGIPLADVTKQFGASATSAAAATTMADLAKQIEAVSSAHGHASATGKSFGEVLQGLNFKTAGVTREFMYLTDEAIQGRFKNMAGSFSVLLNRLGLGQFIFQASTLGYVAAAAAVAALGIAYAQGAVELTHFTTQATLTGNAIGLSAGQFTEMRDSLAGIAVTKGKAAEALGEIATSGMLAGENVKAIATTAVMLERAAGVPLKETVKHFEELGKSPVEASAKLDAQYHYLTASVYSQIKALEDQGRTQDAANLAEATYAEEMTRRAQRILDSQGSLERGWHAIANAAKRGWDAMLDIGREDSAADKLTKANEAVKAAQARVDAAQFATTGGGAAMGGARLGGDQQAALDLAKEGLKDALRRKEIEDGNVLAQQMQAQQARARVDAEKEMEKSLTNEQKLTREIERIRSTFKLAGMSQEDTDRAIASAREKHMRSNTGSNAYAGQAAHNDQIAEENRRLQQQIDTLDFSIPTKLTESESALLKIEEQLNGPLKANQRAWLEKQKAMAEAGVEADKLHVRLTAQAEAVKKEVEVIAQQAKANDTSTESIRSKTAGLIEENANYGKNKTAIEESHLALYNHQLAEAEGSDRFDPKYIASLRLKTAAQKDYVEQLQLAEVHGEKKKLTETGRKNSEDSKTLQEEIALLGMSKAQRDQILAQRKSEVELAKELSDIDKLNAVEADKNELRDLARKNQAIKASNEALQTLYKQVQKLADDMTDTLTDALIKSAEGGKGAFKSLRDWLVHEFNNLILSPIIKAVVAPFSGMVAGATQQFVQSVVPGGTALSGANNALSLGSMASSAKNAYTSIQQNGVVGAAKNYFGFGSGGSGIAGAATTQAEITAGVESTQASLIAAGATEAEAAEAAASLGGFQAANSGVGAAAGGGMGAAMSIAGPIAVGMMVANNLYDKGYHWDTGHSWIDPGHTINEKALGALGIKGKTAAILTGSPITEAIARKLGIGGEMRSGGQYIGDVKQQGPSGGEIGGDASRSLIDSTITDTNSLIKKLGGTTTISQLYSGLESSRNGKGFAYAGAQLSNGTYVGEAEGSIQHRRGSMKDREAFDAFAEELKQVVLQSLQASNIKGKLADWIRSLGDVDQLHGQALEDVFARMQKVMDERATLQQRLDSMTLTSTAALTQTREKERATLDALNADMLDAVYAQEDLKTAEGNLTNAYNSQQAQLQQSSQALRAYATSLKKWVADAFVGTNSPLNAMQKLDVAAQQFGETLAAAHLGDENARGDLTNKASTLLDSIKENATNSVDYAMGFAQVTSAMALEATAANAKATEQEQMLQAAQDQLTQLGLIQTNTKTFADYLTDYQTAKKAADSTLALVTPGADAPAAAAAAAAAPASGAAAADAAPWSINDWAAGSVNEPTGFANGGYHRGGVRLVGENGPEIEVTGSSYIHDAAATRRMLSSGDDGGDNSAVVEAIERLDAALQANVKFTFQMSKDIRELKVRGFPIVNPDAGTRLLVASTAG